MTYNSADAYFFHVRARDALHIARAYSNNPRLRLAWQQRAADYRETLIDQMRRRQGWTLAERLANHRAA